MTIIRESFEDAQLLAQVAVTKHDETYWFAAMQALKEAYGK